MGKIVVLAEKPSVARDIAKVLGCNGRFQGYVEGEKYIVTWAVGHLVRLLEPEEYSAELRMWNISDLPIIPKKMALAAVEATIDQFQIVSCLINRKDIDSLICATDSGREGELIFRYIYNLSDCKKPFQRLWISSMTDEAIRNGFENLKSGSDYDKLYESAKCRSESDWLVGINASRAFSLRYGVNLSIGRVQTPTLAIIVNRFHEISSFVSEAYFEVKVNYEKFSGLWFSLKDENRDTRLTSRDAAKKILDDVVGTEATITDVEKDEKQNPPPLLYDLTELQRDANRKFGYSAEKTLSIAQDLYEKRKVITYPRTDSRYLTEDMVPILPRILQRLNFPPYTDFIAPIIKALPKLGKRVIDPSKVTDHHAIIPVNGNIPNQFTPEERNIFDLVARRFISIFYPYYIYTITRIIATSGEHHFISKGKSINQLGWMELYGDEEKSSGKKKGKSDEEQLLPETSVGEQLKILTGEILSKKTKPPAHYTEATLLSAMENAGRFVEDEELKEQLKENGLGTPATRAGIIERLLSVGYIVRKGKSLLPTDKGIKLIEIVPAELKSPETTGKWERALGLIYKGSMESDRFMGSICRYVRYIVDECRKNRLPVKFASERKKALSGLGECPKCKTGVMLENSKSFYCSEWRAGCRFSIWKDFIQREGLELPAEQFSELLKSGEMVQGDRKIKLDSFGMHIEQFKPES